MNDKTKKPKGTFPAKRGPKGQTVITEKLTVALKAMICEGYTLIEASDKAGFNVPYLEERLKVKGVQEEIARIEREFLQSARFKSRHVAIHLMENSSSDHVRLAAAKWITEQSEETATGGHSGTKILININNSGAPRPGEVQFDEKTGQVTIEGNSASVQG